MSFDVIMPHNDAKQRVKDLGWDSFLEDFQKEYESYNLYSCSTYWVEDPHYICKLRGTKGDVIIGWQGVHDR